MSELKLNASPAPTYRWLRMGGKTLPVPAIAGPAPVKEELPDGLLRRDAPQESSIRTGCGEEADRLILDALPLAAVYTAPRGRDCGVLRLRFAFSDAGGEGPATVNAVHFELEPGSALTVVMDYAADASAAGKALVRTTARLGEGAVLRLVQIQRLGEGYTLLNTVGAVSAENARMETSRLVLGGRDTYDGSRILLSGGKSSFRMDTGYTVGGEGRLDMNHEVLHEGKKTVSLMTAAGVLRDRASKLLRGTIDFRTGCSGAVGTESEDVLMMDEQVHNQSIPVILCAEEDVEGNHGATIGRLDENLVFYLSSRGMDRDEIYEMMARARLDAVIRRLPDETMRRELLPEEEEA